MATLSNGGTVRWGADSVPVALQRAIISPDLWDDALSNLHHHGTFSRSSFCVITIRVRPSACVCVCVCVRVSCTQVFRSSQPVGDRRQEMKKTCNANASSCRTFDDSSSGSEHISPPKNQIPSSRRCCTIPVALYHAVLA